MRHHFFTDIADLATARPFRDACTRLAEAGVRVSLFIDADIKQIEAAKRTGAPVIEIHTGHYADAGSREQKQALLNQIKLYPYSERDNPTAKPFIPS